MVKHKMPFITDSFRLVIPTLALIPLIPTLGAVKVKGANSFWTHNIVTLAVNVYHYNVSFSSIESIFLGARCR